MIIRCLINRIISRIDWNLLFVKRALFLRHLTLYSNLSVTLP